jgi:hypothetical protein
VDREHQRRLVLHAIIIIFLGLLAGFPFATAISSGTAENVRAWRMAHMEGVLNGLLMLAIAGVGSSIVLEGRKQAIVFWSLIITGYGNIGASIIGASTGFRGLEPAGPAANWVVFILFMLGIVAVIVAMGLVGYGARPGANAVSAKVSVEVTSSGAVKTVPPKPRATVDTSAAVTSVSTSVDVSADDDDDDDDDDNEFGAPMSRAERRRAKSKKGNR